MRTRQCSEASAGEVRWYRGDETRPYYAIFVLHDEGGFCLPDTLTLLQPIDKIMRNHTCGVCSIPMTLVQTIGEGKDDVVFYKCPKCSREVFVGYFTVSPNSVSNGSETKRIGFGQVPTSSTSHKGGVW
ncbi:MAG: hypothetical protein UX89_C0010G0005 [Parcubacteria group bacterium GW2011_GWA2_47_16]|nr:MAG: hypothetical protein UX89_C0010G0005 [Parcubacteria group bacterium GW2011_GWA2_47_16]